MIQPIGVIIFGLLGFSLSAHIRRTKTSNKRLTCFIGENCNDVVHSRYSKTLGIPNEITGMLYYAIIVLAYTTPFVLSVSRPAFLDTLLLIVTGLASVFSCYLIYIQLHVLREWCEWCIASGILPILIFLLIVL